MGAGDIFNIGVSGLVSYQNALSTTSNNIANIYTPGFSRETPLFAERQGAVHGIGVDFDGNQRHFDQFAELDLRSTLTQYNKSATFFEYSQSLDNYLSNEGASVNKSMEDLFGALQMTLSSPNSSPARAVLLNNAQTLVDRFQSVNKTLSTQTSILNQSVSSSVEEVNGIVDGIAELNRVIGINDNVPNQILDEKNQLLKKLAEFVPISTIDQGKQTNVYLNSGDSLVMNGKASLLTAKASPTDPQAFDVYLTTDYSSVSVSNEIHTGKLGAMLSVRHEILDKAQVELNHMAMVLSDAMNTQHQSGLDLNGSFGGLFYTDVNQTSLVNNRVIPNNNNSGTGSFQVTIEQSDQTKASKYSMSMSTANNYTITRLADKTVVASGSIAGFPANVSFDGVKVTIPTASFSAGDQYTIDPSENIIRQMELKVHDTSSVALAAPVLAAEQLTNTGSGVISFNGVSDITNGSFATPGQLAPPLSIEFLSATTFQVVNATTSGVVEGPITYNPATGGDVFPTPSSYDPGYRISLTGNMRTGDKFDMTFNLNPDSDNRNGIELASLQSKALVGGTKSLQDNYAEIVNRVANQTHFADIAQQSNQILLESAQSRRDNISGVNMDEEAAMLMQYQKAYQASAQLIAVADSVFNTIIDLGR